MAAATICSLRALQNMSVEHAYTFSRAHTGHGSLCMKDIQASGPASAEQSWASS